MRQRHRGLDCSTPERAEQQAADGVSALPVTKLRHEAIVISVLVQSDCAMASTEIMVTIRAKAMQITVPFEAIFGVFWDDYNFWRELYYLFSTNTIFLLRKN